MIALFCAILGLAVAAPAATAATRFVNDDAIPAGCPAQYPTISAAVAVSNAGDVVFVCAGVYADFVDVFTPRVTIKGQFLPPDLATCNATRTALYTTMGARRFSIVQGSFNVHGDRDVVDSLVFDGQSVFFDAIKTDPAASGYLLQNNLVQDYDEGIIFDASGTILSRATSNCLRNNADTGFLSDSLANAGITSNHTFANANIGISVNDLNSPPSKVTVASNIMNSDFWGIEMDGSTGSSISSNIIKNTAAAGICIGFANTGLLVQSNIITTAMASHGVLVDGCPFSSGFGPNTGLKIQSNVSTTGSDGFDVPTDDSLQSSQITANIFKSTGGNAMWIEPTVGNFGNKFTANIATGGTGFFGCRDDTTGTGTAGTANTWGDSNIGKPHNFPMALCFPHK